MPEDARFCPNCGSTSVEPYSKNWALEAAGGQTNIWECNNCGYTGFMPAGNPKDFKDQEQDVGFEPQKLGNGQNFPRAYFKYYLYIVLPVLAALMVYLFLS